MAVIKVKEIQKGAQIVFSMIVISLATISAWGGQYLLSVALWILSILMDIRLELEEVIEKLEGA